MHTVTYTGRSHYKATDIAIRSNMWLGIPVIVTSSIVGTSIFATLGDSPAAGWRIVAGLLSVVVVLSALQTFFKFAQAAERHRTFGANYGALRREIEMFIVQLGGNNPPDRDGAVAGLQKLASKISELASEGPGIPNKAFKRAAREIKEEQGKLPTSVGKILEQAKQ